MGDQRAWEEQRVIKFRRGGWASAQEYHDLDTTIRGIRFDAYQELNSFTGHRVALDLTPDEAEEMAIALLLSVREIRRDGG